MVKGGVLSARLGRKGAPLHPRMILSAGAGWAAPDGQVQRGAESGRSGDRGTERHRFKVGHGRKLAFRKLVSCVWMGVDLPSEFLGM